MKQSKQDKMQGCVNAEFAVNNIFKFYSFLFMCLLNCLFLSNIHIYQDLQLMFYHPQDL